MGAYSLKMTPPKNATVTGSASEKAERRSSRRFSHGQLLSGDDGAARSAASALRRNSIGSSKIEADGPELEVCRMWMNEQRDMLLEDLYGRDESSAGRALLQSARRRSVSFRSPQTESN